MFKKIRKKYQEYNGYREDFDGDISKISFFNICKTESEIILDKLLNIDNIPLRSNVNILFYRRQIKKYQIEVSIKQGIYYYPFFTYQTEENVDFKNICKKTDLIKKSMLELNIPVQKFINQINQNEKLGPVSKKRLQKYFEKYDYINRFNIPEISANMNLWGHETNYIAKYKILYGVIRNELI